MGGGLLRGPGSVSIVVEIVTVGSSGLGFGLYMEVEFNRVQTDYLELGSAFVTNHVVALLTLGVDIDFFAAVGAN